VKRVIALHMEIQRGCVCDGDVRRLRAIRRT
jgi:hypothetical protein